MYGTHTGLQFQCDPGPRDLTIKPSNDPPRPPLTIETSPGFRDYDINILQEHAIEIALPVDSVFESWIKVTVKDADDNSVAGVGFVKLDVKGNDPIMPADVIRMLELAAQVTLS